jgi:GPH family glycoside/pentoside/hexuronide:cation symporter
MESTLSKREKLAYGMGTIPGVFYNSFFGQIQAFYYSWMGLGIKYIVIGQIIYAIWNVINDPIFGVLQDHTRTSRGRYIPWIKWFSPIFTIAFIALFLVPNNWRYAYSGEDTQLLVFFWYVVTLVLYDLGLTVVYIAHSALLPQISSSFSERTQISVLSILLGVIATLLSGVFPVLFLTNPTFEKIFWFKITVIIFGLISMIPWWFIWRYLHERQELIPVQKDGFWVNVKYVFKNPACRVYMIYDGITVGINNNFFTAITFIIAWTFGVENPFSEINHVIEIGDILIYIVIPVVCIFVGLWIQIYVPKKWDLRTLLMLDYIFMGLGSLISYFGALPTITQSDIIFQSPQSLWFVSIGFGIFLLGFLGSLIYLNPLNADVVDYDEYLTGNRREAVYSGVNCVFSKPMQSVALIIFPAIVSAFGLVAASPDDPTSSALIVQNGMRNAIKGVAIGSFLFPAILAGIGIIFWVFYPLNSKKLTEIRIYLAKKHAKQKEEYLTKT